MSLIRRFVVDAQDMLHHRAERIRIVTWGHQEEMRAKGLPADYVEQWGRLSLAWANVLDALAGRDKETTAHR